MDNLSSDSPLVVVVDNDDSFTGSLVQLFRMQGARIRWDRWDATDTGALGEATLILLSPGPGAPAERPVNLAIARDPPAPVFGVCLGMQAIGEAWGARVGRAPVPRHGRASAVRHAGAGCFGGPEAPLPSPVRATRYHSLAVTELPACLEATAWAPDGVLMGLRHRARPLEAVQFHPESVRTHHGAQLARNVLAWAVSARADLRVRPPQRSGPGSR